nr:hypothetical protein LOC559910 [Haemonchus contortus]
MSLALAGHMDMELARKLLDPATKKREYVCQRHVVQAAQFLLAEMAMLGSRIRHFDDPSASGRTAYVAFVDIPQSIVHNLNYASDEAVVKTRDVGHFLNDTLRRYYATKLWPVTDQVDVEESPCGESKHDAGEEAHDSKVSEEELTDSPEEDSGENADDPDFNIDDESESDSPIASCLGETDEDVSNQYFLVKGVKLLELFQFCPRCGNRLLGARLKAVGTAAVVKFACEKCRNKDKMWESQERTVSSSRERMHKGNVEAVVSAVTTGLRYQELADWAQQTNLSIFSKTFFFKVFAWTRAAIERVYLSQQNHVLETVKDAYEETGGLHLIVDGNVDSREHSELIGKVMLVEARTELVLHTEALHLPEIGGTTTRLEIEGLRRLMAWTQARGLHVGSVTTDRSKALRAALREMEPEIGDISHYYYGKRLVKWLDRELRKAAKLDGCGGIGPWIEKLKTHLLSVIKHGAVDETNVQAAFNTCLMHVQDVHQWPMDVLTGPYTRCAHESLEEPLPNVLNVDSKEYEELRKVVLTKSFQRDLLRASPFEGTSINEAKNTKTMSVSFREFFFEYFCGVVVRRFLILM